MISPWRLGKDLLSVAAVLLLPQLACAGSLNLGSISANPVGESKKFSSFTSYLAQQLQSEGFDQGRVVVAESIPAMSSLLQTRRVDLYIDSLFPSLAVSRLSGSRFLLRRWKTGKSEYRSIIFTRKDSGMARLEDLKGKIVAFEESFSSTGYFFPKVDLLKKGFRLAPKRQGSEPVNTDEVGYVFSRGDTNTLFWVLNGMVAAGAVDDQKYFVFTKNRDIFRILHESVSFPRQLVSYRADFPAKLVARVKTLLLNMHQSEEGEKALRAFESTTKFDEIPVQAIDLMAGLKKYIEAELKLQ
ncbi:MAG: phosphate/phosphite/phosphonate ABC transporter substrate-binding protein [Deltaproteobacteria bacterium]|nr:phosphate/phosphite/phosphonate ABC transporter substrate-binding protein [Deltaproteobacteria bacterium]